MKNNFQFKKWESIKRNTNRISLNGSTLTIGKDAYESIGKPQKVDIYYDDQRNVLKLVPSETGRKIVEYNSTHLIRLSLTARMPRGRYFFSDGVFVLQPRVKET